MKKFVLLLILTIFFGTLGAAFSIVQTYMLAGARAEKIEVIHEIPKGRSLTQAARELQEKGVIRNSQIFLLYARFLGQSDKMKVGEYQFFTDMTPKEVLDVLTSGRSIGRKLTISEGLNLWEIGELIQSVGISTQAEFMEYVKSPTVVQKLVGEMTDPSLEGYLFPETYQVTKYTALPELVGLMVQKFKDEYAPLEPLAKQLGWTRHQVVTLASIIEKETGAPQERELISSVFHNRLKQGMMLQTDPTVLYAKWLASGRTELKIGRADLQFEHPYNTYKVRGLPPGPIANPGFAALKATLKPATSDYLFFVSQNDGTHVFSKNYKDHQAAVKKFQLDPKAREGKSWRDLNRSDPALQSPPTR